MKKLYRSPIFRLTEIEKKDVLTVSTTGNINDGSFGLGEMELPS